MGKTSKYESKPADAQGRVIYTDIENDTWDRLVKRQLELLDGRACDEYIRGVEILNFGKTIPQLPDITKLLKEQTGWAVQPVPAIIPAEEFFTLLSTKRFPAANFIRIPEEFDYIKEPDIFHEVFGHCPLLTHQGYADYMEEYGKIALSVKGKLRMRLFRLFWFTIEFGLLKQRGQYRAYGGGILSSNSETVHAIDSQAPERVPMDPRVALRTPYRIDILQPIYFVLDSLEAIYNLLDEDLVELAKEACELGDFEPKYPPKEESVEEKSEESMRC